MDVQGMGIRGQSQVFYNVCIIVMCRCGVWGMD